MTYTHTFTILSERGLSWWLYLTYKMSNLDSQILISLKAGYL
jgi:hypothetical protein